MNELILAIAMMCSGGDPPQTKQCVLQLLRCMKVSARSTDESRLEHCLAAEIEGKK